MNSFRTMKDFKCQEGRSFNIAGLGSGSTLLRHRHILLIISLLVFIPAFLAVSCDKEIKSDNTDVPDKEETDITVLLKIGKEALRRSDIFIYNDNELEYHMRTEGPEVRLHVKCTPGEKSIYVVANCPHDFNIKALSSLSSIGKLSFSFRDDNDEFPIMGGEARCGCEDETTVEISLSPLICHVILSEISSNLDDYELLESPRIRLKGINAEAALFSDRPYIPEDLIEYGEWHELPYDIGMLTQNPGIRLDCYPNESDVPEYSPERTTLELQCRIKGESHSFEYALPAFGRNSNTYVSLEIDGPGDFKGNIE